MSSVAIFPRPCLDPSRAQGSGFRIQGLEGLEFRDPGLGHLGFRV